MSEVRNEGSFPSFVDPIAPLRVALRGRYEFERQIGQGAFATVYLARDLKHERVVAIKVLNADPTSETGEIRFIREIRLVARLQHPNILPLHDSGHVEALLYYVMPFVEGETLRLRMNRERQMAVDAARGIARETADALAYAHKQGIVHRDIKPENILLSGGHAVVADFGIARAIDIAGVRQLTATGVAGPGTPAYMSPEQLLGDRAVDARSDIYSLGCVLYEMLVARPPYSGKDGFVKRFTEPPPHISSLRRDTPPWLDTVIATALAKDPNDRYPTAADFIAALEQPAMPIRTPGRAQSMKHALASPPLFDGDPLEEQELGAAFPDSYPSGGAKPAPSTNDKPYRSRLEALIRGNPRAAGAIAVSALAALVVTAAFARVSPLSALFAPSPLPDSTRYLILPLAGDPVAGKRVAKALSETFAGWTGIDVVSDPEVADALGSGGEASSLRSARDLARKLGAGRLIWGEVSGKGDASLASVELYDVSRGENANLRHASIGALDPEALTSAFITLFKPADRPRSADAGDAGTRSFPAWTAYGRGHVALGRWDLTLAEREFRAAVDADRNYAAAHLWLAQTQAWRMPGSRSEWQEHATRAATNSAALGERDKLIASSLAAMASDDYPAACQSYTALVQRDSLDFAGWYGLGECRANDSLIVADGSSPSGWKFRGSYHRGAFSYRKALRLEPAALSKTMFGRIQGVLPTGSTKIRLGKRAPPGREVFLAFPALVGDTLAFVPYPSILFAAAAPPLTRNAALERNKDYLHTLAVDWTRQAPQSADAYEALEDVLEARGDIDSRARGPSALDAVRRARSLSTDPLQRLRLASREAWLRFKRREFKTAAFIADSLLRVAREPGPEEARLLIGLAALTGKVAITADLARITRPFAATPAEPIPSTIDELAGHLLAHAALGTCSDTVAAIEAQLRERIGSDVAEENRNSVESALTARPASMLVPCTGGVSALRLTSSPDRLLQLQNAFARGNLARVRALFDTINASQRMQRPADISLDRTYQEAWLRRAIGDTAGAVRQLNRTLATLGSIGAASLQEHGSFPAAAAAPRAMLLRAEIAATGGDARTAKMWIRALDALWQNADPVLAEQLRRVRAMADKPQ